MEQGGGEKGEEGGVSETPLTLINSREQGGRGRRDERISSEQLVLPRPCFGCSIVRNSPISLSRESCGKVRFKASLCWLCCVDVYVETRAWDIPPPPFLPFLFSFSLESGYVYADVSFSSVVVVSWRLRVCDNMLGGSTVSIWQWSLGDEGRRE